MNWEQGLFTTALNLRSIPSFARLIRILLRLIAFLETRSSEAPLSRLGSIAFEGYFMSWSSDIEIPVDGISHLTSLMDRMEDVFLVFDKNPRQESPIHDDSCRRTRSDIMWYILLALDLMSVVQSIARLLVGHACYLTQEIWNC